MKKIKIILFILGLFLIVSPYFFEKYILLRLLSVLIGISLVVTALTLKKEKKALKIIIYPFILLILCYTLDYLKVAYLNALPIFAIKVTSSEKVSIYNSFSYRVYACEKENIFDKGYTKAYACPYEDLEHISVNELLADAKASFQKYEGKFIHLTGKMSSITGNSSLTLSAFDEESHDVNGYVNFDQSKKVIIKDLQINPEEYNIYDLLQVAGLVQNYKETSEEIIIYLSSASLKKSLIYNDYDLLVNENDSKDLTKASEQIYYLGLQGIYYKYDEDNIYELVYLLEDGKEKLENILPENKELYENGTLYEQELYNIFACQDEKVVFVNKNIKDFSNICN